MAQAPLIFGPAHWRQRAKEARRLAEHLDDESKVTMLEIAHAYDQMAELAERRSSADDADKPEI